MQRSTHVFPRYLNQNVVHIPTPCPSGHHDLVVPLPLSEQHIRVMWLPHTQLSANFHRFSVPWLSQTLVSDGRAVNVESAMEKEAWTGSLSLSLSLARTHKRARSLSVSLYLSLSLIFNTFCFINLIDSVWSCTHNSHRMHCCFHCKMATRTSHDIIL